MNSISRIEQRMRGPRRVIRPPQFAQQADLPAMSHRVQPSAIVVEQSSMEAVSMVTWLVEALFHVTVADNFAEAKKRLIEWPPALLLTELKLGAYNGLELVLRGKSRRPSMAAVVLSDDDDRVLQADADGMGATFVLKPVDARELRAAAFRTLFRPVDTSTPLPPLRPPFERRSAERRQRLSPVSFDRREADRRQSVLTMFSADTERVTAQ